MTVQMVQETLNQVPGTDSRVTILGHIQRGGIPSALDRTLVRISKGFQLILSRVPFWD